MYIVTRTLMSSLQVVSILCTSCSEKKREKGNLWNQKFRRFWIVTLVKFSIPDCNRCWLHLNDWAIHPGIQAGCHHVFRWGISFCPKCFHITFNSVSQVPCTQHAKLTVPKMLLACMHHFRFFSRNPLGGWMCALVSFGLPLPKLATYDTDINSPISVLPCFYQVRFHVIILTCFWT